MMMGVVALKILLLTLAKRAPFHCLILDKTVLVQLTVNVYSSKAYLINTCRTYDITTICTVFSDDERALAYRLNQDVLCIRR